jgi:hypothetical protein
MAKRKYPKIYEKIIPIALILLGMLIITLLVFAITVLAKSIK